MTIAQISQSAALYEAIRERDELLEPSGVTVVVPVFNDYSFLMETLGSIAAQTLPPLETIVVDDGSHAVAGREIRQMASAFNCRYVRVTNRGLGAARNTGLMLAKGKGFLPLDADDKIHPLYIEKTWPLMEAGAEIVLTGIQEHGEYPRNAVYMPGYDRPWQQVTADFLLASHNRFFYASLLSVAMMREVGGYNTRMDGGYLRNASGFEDWDLWIDLLKRGRKFAAVEEPLFVYRTTGGGQMLVEAERHRDQLVAEIHRHHA